MDAPLHLSLEFDQHLLRNTSSPLPSPSTAGPPFECRICQEEEDEFSPLETPCACSGSLRYAHRKCIQRWCNEKGNTICEVCQQHGYIAPQSREQQNITIELSEWGIRDLGTFQVHHPRILALAAAERHLLASDYEEYVAVSSSAFFCRSVALLLMVLLLFRYGLDLAVTAEDGDPSMILMIFLLRLVGFFLPCYIIIQAMNMLQQSQQVRDTPSWLTFQCGNLSSSISFLSDGRHRYVYSVKKQEAHPPRSCRIESTTSHGNKASKFP